ncbi:IclR family transcriptional regulator [Tropicimonas isoalkanivorans]|uniref:Transcriptional regulator, IclR family n=1 Tax=Tropicimonas isoalkanivorans TaxID=441112 RepID=A0A1I1HUF5_9RHOB|nr:IclR family transcriptional regulator [Tropicimonas isoalkanivorans]SFC27789.1 transcriptional regulator, IclR family [Tropicimonas isoalkanivorans]
MTGKPEAPRSIGRLIGTFEIIAVNENGLTLAQLAEKLESPKSSLLTMLRPLVQQDYLSHENGRYFLGPAVFGWASKILANSRSAEVIRDYLARLRDASGETAIFVTLDRNNDVIDYVEVFESTQAIRYCVQAGVTRPLYPSAAGQLMLAFQEPGWQSAYLDRTPLKRVTEATVVDRSRIEARLIEIRRSGISFSVDGAVSGAAGLAAPVFRGGGTLAGCLLLGAPSNRAVRNRAALEKTLGRIVRETSIALGCQDYDTLIREKSAEIEASASR